MQTREDLLICVACGTQFDVPTSTPLSACRICDDPRQFVPHTGQAWTSLSQLRGKHHNKFRQDDICKQMWSISTEPKFGIGQRCILLQTPSGNVLWDCIAFLDEETVGFIRGKGGLRAIVISHPHYYTTHLDWARTFDCPVFLSVEDREWICQAEDPEQRREMIEGSTEEIVEGVLAIKVGGHFPGSLVLKWEKMLFIADSIVTVPSAYYHIDRMPGTTSYAFMWSIPNMIPLPPAALHEMWLALKPFDCESTHGAFEGTEVRDRRVKERVLESMQIQARVGGWEDIPILKETL